MAARDVDLMGRLWPNPEAALVCLLSALAIGLVTPLLYYLIVWPWSIGIGLLIAVDCLGRFAGVRILIALERRLGYTRAISIAQTTATLAYALMAFAGLSHAGVPNVGLAWGFVLIYLSRFMAFAASAGFPSVLGLTHRTGDWTRSSLIATGVGFVVGCALTGVFVDSSPFEGSILPTGRLVNAAGAAAIISAISVVLAWRLPERERMKVAADSHVIVRWSGRYVVTAAVCETAFGMMIVAGPLLQRKTYLYPPNWMGIFFAFAALCSVAVEMVDPNYLRRRLPSRLGVILGLLLSAVGFFGFAVALQVSLVTRFDLIWLGRVFLWEAGMFAGLGHGLLQVSLPVRLDKEFAGRASARGYFRLDDLGEAVRGAAALFAGAIWSAHERSSMALPCFLALVAIWWTLWPGAGARKRAEGMAAAV
jgi:hypothetical protein